MIWWFESTHIYKFINMNIKGINKLTDEEIQDVDEFLDIWSFENYCGSCDNFDTENCPHYGEVFKATDWRDIKCDNFWD